MLIVYMLKGVMAGDVKLLGLIAGFLTDGDITKYIILVFYVAAFMGFIKIIMQYIGNNMAPKTTIKFTGPILIGYLILFYTKGGI